MHPRHYRTEGIILKRQNIGEADRLLTVFTRHHGKIRCLAKGVRKPTSRKSASIELFHRTVLYLAKGRQLDVLTQTEMVENFPNIRKRLKAVKAAFHCAELVDLLTAENQENETVFSDLLEVLGTIDREQQLTRGQVTQFERKLLSELGFGLPNSPSRESLKDHIESIIERKLRTAEVFKEV
ncbi:MAG: DNA repair protein RecO [Candidatus Chisholmbacteria bacterium RIFCSPHIGHO2_12_FULL_49_9]|uniref:DNA repair protein RecO n=1 Tax=Candidatus Chisholmbacteria bacterium RIFCSPHIGHO2_01_FULL_52_32 TaxID=1797591 RepID=A0A1G1VSS5_9BACT|nr:MAG: DNA repair protein RecO [Candidatus Chisholmbacteria bacterium RIFCSPHIGHO2_01_FULL_52_32]OGY20170.1 MAG: DNA repair protein RecO [Candidatus Chisholmbacteria bacterium RIFCSPLOWO2_01_FULL_50_28]OGY20748.1 MAG: DNA repair protein RecO [Candidatus Chisholmbacteria bacterium RIFCSPHIGHO2_12_FULL_49_9]